MATSGSNPPCSHLLRVKKAIDQGNKSELEDLKIKSELKKLPLCGDVLKTIGVSCFRNKGADLFIPKERKESHKFRALR